MLFAVIRKKLKFIGLFSNGYAAVENIIYAVDIASTYGKKHNKAYDY